MKKTIVLTLLAFLLISSPKLIADTKIKVGIYNFEPLIFMEKNNSPNGLYIDVLKHIANEENWQVEYVFGSWNECLNRLKNAEIDLLPSIAYSKEREQTLDFTEEYLFLDWGIVYQHKDSDIKNIFDLRGKKIGALKGSIYTKGFKDLMHQFGIKYTLIEMNEYTKIFKSIEDNKVDAGINAQMYSVRIENNYNIKRTHIYFSPAMIKFAVPKNKNRIILSTLDKHFTELKNDNNSIYHELYDNWIGAYKRETIFPRWLIWTSITIAAGLFISFIFIYTLDKRVKLKTAELEVTNKNLYESELKFRSIFNNTRDAIGVSLHGIHVFANPAYLDLFGYDDINEIIDLPILDLIAPSEHKKINENVENRAQNKYASTFYETIGLKKDKTEFHMETAVSTYNMHDKNYTLVIIRDITDRKTSESKIKNSLKEKEVLLAEIHHRVKNNMQIMSALLLLQKEKSTNEETIKILDVSSNRILSMALIHEQLYQFHDFTAINVGIYIQELSDKLNDHYSVDNKKINFEFIMQNYSLGINTMIPFGLILNELITNSYKHAFNNSQNGKITILLKKQNDIFIMNYSDSGPGPDSSLDLKNAKTLGFVLIANLANQLDGKIEIIENTKKNYIQLTFKEQD